MLQCNLCQDEISTDNEVDFLNDEVVHSSCLPNLRKEDGSVVIDISDELSQVEEMKRLQEVTEIIEDSQSISEAQEKLNERFSGGSDDSGS